MTSRKNMLDEAAFQTSTCSVFPGLAVPRVIYRYLATKIRVCNIFDYFICNFRNFKIPYFYVDKTRVIYADKYNFMQK